jgi:predicted TIM-barrel fold metal-dependent hydrolase
MIIDAHAHIFHRVHGLTASGPTEGIGFGRVAVGNEQIQIMPPLSERTVHTPDMLLAHMDWVGVHKAILLQGPFYGECNKYAVDAVRAHRDRLIGVAYLDPWGQDAQKEFDFICSTEIFVGVKLEFSESTGLAGIHRGAKLADGNIAWVWRELERRGMILVIDLGAIGSVSYQTEAVHSIAKRHPNLTVVIAHLAQPNPSVEADAAKWRSWEEQISLGLLPNVYFDTASLPAYVASEGYPFPSAGRYLRLAIDEIGSSKVMWGTDIPGLLAHATYSQLLQSARHHLKFLPEPERELVLGKNAERVYGRPIHP